MQPFTELALKVASSAGETHTKQTEKLEPLPKNERSNVVATWEHVSQNNWGAISSAGEEGLSVITPRSRTSSEISWWPISSAFDLNDMRVHTTFTEIKPRVISISDLSICRPENREDRETTNNSKTENMMRNGASVLKELIASSNGNYNPYRIFSAQELKLATNKYDQKNVITEDWGCILYKGFWQERLISVMRFRESNRDEHGSCINNIVYAAQMSHNHILKLIGCCLETQIPILAFESVEYGNLRDRILSASQPQIEPLLMKHRLKIAMDIAHALAYLHFGFPRPIVYRDFKTAHILFNEENVAKLFDFSLSISIPEGETHITDRVIGTWGYCAPEYQSTGVFNEKSDVYGFGAFLFELLTGQIISDLMKAADNLGCPLEEYFKKFIEDNSFTEIVDHIIIQDILCLRKEQQLHAYAQLMSECLKESPVDRPTMMAEISFNRHMYTLVECARAGSLNEKGRVESSSVFATREVSCYEVPIVE
ncbi:hypothetical protein WN943_007783 [Citrus x changshan-huyou]